MPSFRRRSRRGLLRKLGWFGWQAGCWLLHLVCLPLAVVGGAALVRDWAACTIVPRAEDVATLAAFCAHSTHVFLPLVVLLSLGVVAIRLVIDPGAFAFPSLETRRQPDGRP